LGENGGTNKKGPEKSQTQKQKIKNVFLVEWGKKKGGPTIKMNMQKETKPPQPRNKEKKRTLFPYGGGGKKASTPQHLGTGP